MCRNSTFSGWSGTSCRCRCMTAKSSMFMLQCWSEISPHHSSTLHRQIYTLSVQRWERGAPETKNFTQFRNINAPHGRIAWAIFTKSRVFHCEELAFESIIKIWADSIHGFRSCMGLHLGGALSSNFQRP